ncbi:Mur ligase family protein [Conexibacter sp. JD483]|uniref:Mur ligase family protein n=1 Tax=unclassified Conexibacter TaxID=2627773 RepID=UPI0027233CF9|nr:MULTISPECIES: Mur ligase family protein [unclassified Conexibacter]MDO8187909.1 Mur ligase family protein [Conexibacter sp. CPCC 205706]MDO8198640.1 Mur ligase family protein [Conexibacter sp. CPCC 205762]MDR9369680.1 Mur ligase family protein [Conexibacter sp. JD483]
MTVLTSVLIAVAALVALGTASHMLLHVFQQEHYEARRLYLWVSQAYGVRLALPEAGLLFVGALASALAGGSEPALGVILAIVLVALTARYAQRVWTREQIKPLVFTPRARRLFGLQLALGALLLAIVVALGGSGEFAPAATGAVGALLLLLAPWLLGGVVNRLLRPVQQADNRRFVRRAEQRLREVRPLVVGITGSYGKTTTKACVAAVLDLLGPSYPTPASFNSQLGVVRAINEGLQPTHQSFVVEMGAYRRGDVQDLCDLVHPRAGVLTAIGPAHLERFGSLDVTEQAKGELADAIPAEGLFVTRADDERCLRVARTRAAGRVLLFAPAPHPEADLWAEGIRLQDGRSIFTVVVRAGVAGDDEQRAEVRARLLGEHNVANLLAAAAVGLGEGLALADVARALGKVPPPDHRLAPIVNRAAGVVVIDDSYNANPEGAAAALGVLRDHPATRRLLVTPGMVELGEREREENRRLGELAAAVADVAVLIGPRGEDVRAGMLAAGAREEQLHHFPDGPSAHAKVAELTRAGDVVLFENDLPDVYA